MALNRKRSPQLAELIQRAAEEVKRLNPHIGEPQRPMSDEEWAEEVRSQEELERIWDEIDRQRGGPDTEETGAKIVIEDRGER